MLSIKKLLTFGEDAALTYAEAGTSGWSAFIFLFVCSILVLLRAVRTHFSKFHHRLEFQIFFFASEMFAIVIRNGGSMFFVAGSTAMATLCIAVSFSDITSPGGLFWLGLPTAVGSVAATLKRAQVLQRGRRQAQTIPRQCRMLLLLELGCLAAIAASICVLLLFVSSSGLDCELFGPCGLVAGLACVAIAGVRVRLYLKWGFGVTRYFSRVAEVREARLYMDGRELVTSATADDDEPQFSRAVAPGLSQPL